MHKTQHYRLLDGNGFEQARKISWQRFFKKSVLSALKCQCDVAHRFTTFCPFFCSIFWATFHVWYLHFSRTQRAHKKTCVSTFFINSISLHITIIFGWFFSLITLFLERTPSLRRQQQNRRPNSSYIPTSSWNVEDLDFGTVIQRPQITKLWLLQTQWDFVINNNLWM